MFCDGISNENLLMINHILLSEARKPKKAWPEESLMRSLAMGTA